MTSNTCKSKMMAEATDVHLCYNYSYVKVRF